MDTTLVPTSTHVAAKRGFLRTTSQAYAASIGTGAVSAAALVSLTQDPDPVVLICTAVAALISPILAGVASYLDILARGIPEDYQTPTPSPEA